MTPANEDRPLEIERKFLIRMPDPDRLAAESKIICCTFYNSTFV